MAPSDAIYEVDHQHDLPTHVLASFTVINVDAYTNFVASIMLRDFQLPIKGQRYITAALSNLPVFNAIDERLQFGWGDRSMMRSQYIQAQGYEHASLMIALSSTFHESYAAEVFHAMTVSTAGPNDTVPHIKQWREIIRASNGAFTALEFGIMVEDYIRLDPFSISPGSNLSSRRCRVPPQEMARALLALSKITSKKSAQLTLIGGALIGWIAAVAEFFYDLQVSLKSWDGTHLHGVQSVDEAQLILYYHDAPDLKVTDQPQQPMSDTIMKADDYAYSSHVHYLPFGGRVNWQALLPKVFGRAYRHLDHEEAQALNTIIGAAARCLEDNATTDVNNDHISQSNRATASSYGIGLINNITAWLPELQRGQAKMERQLKKSPEEASGAYFSSFEKLQKLCHCFICSSSETQDQPQDGYCLSVIVETIIALGLAISRMVVTSRLFPSREGIQGLYQSQVQNHLKAQDLERGTGPWFRIIYGNEWNASDVRRLQNAAQLFSGTRPLKQLPSSTIGLAHEGFCVYMLRLEKSDKTLHKPGDEGLIRVVSGSIFGKSKLYNRISVEPVVSDEEEEAWAWEEVNFDHWSTPLYVR